MPIRVYADTSVYGGVFDPGIDAPSGEFFAQVKTGAFSWSSLPSSSMNFEKRRSAFASSMRTTCLGLNLSTSPVVRLRDGLVLDQEKYRYQKFCSDIAGQDIEAHNGKTQTAVTIVRNFLQNARAGSARLDEKERLIPSGSFVFERYENFLSDLPALCDSLSLNRLELIFTDYVTLCVEWLKAHPRLVLLPES